MLKYIARRIIKVIAGVMFVSSFYSPTLRRYVRYPILHFDGNHRDERSLNDYGDRPGKHYRPSSL